jgi:UDP-N-acetylglucosamine:LPS N-acetylglucosamine transferase
LWQIKKKNVDLNNEYNQLIKKRTRFEVEYQRIKNQDNELKEKKSEDRESLEIFVESVRNTSNLIAISDLIISKKLFDSSIFIDKKNSNIEN